MELSLYKALSSIKIEEPLVDAVIKAMDTHIDAGISRSVIPVLAEIRSLAAKVDAYAGIKSDQVARKRWIIDKLFTVAATVVATVGTTIGALKVLGYL